MSAVEKVLAALGVEVLAEKRGRLFARCPFHEDENPSWSIHATKCLHHCFSCDAGGNLTGLVMHVHKIDRDAAKAWLEGVAGGEVEADPEPLPETVRLEFAPLRGSRPFLMPREFIAEPLGEWVTPARKYAERRGITPQQVGRWFLGYAVDGKLAGRIVIPTTTRAGFACGYMARSFADARRRYLYPAASERPDLDTMFGELHWPSPAARGRNEVVVTEGALNALAVERAKPGTGYLAALGGRHVRPMHAGKLATFGLVTILTDPDDAGDAVARELQLALGRHAETRRVRLPPLDAGGKKQDANDLPREELARWLATPA